MLMILLCLCSLLGARAGNVVTIGTAEGAPGEEVTVSVALSNTDVVSALQLSIPLDDNFSLVEGSATLNSSRTGGHSVSAGVKDGAINVMVYSVSMSALNGNSGELLTFKLKLGNTPTTSALNADKMLLTGTDGTTLDGSTVAGSVTVRCAKAQYSTMEIDYGEVPIRSTYNRTLTIQNIGNAPLVVTALEFSDMMTFSSTATLPLEIGAGSSRNITVKYAPQLRGTVRQTMKVVCNSISKLNTIVLKAQPFAVNELHVGNVEGTSDEVVTIPLTMNNMDAISGFQLEFNMPEQLEYVDGSFTLSDRKDDHQLVATLNGRKLTAIAFSTSGKTFSGEDGLLATFQVALKGRYNTSLVPTKTVLSATYEGQMMNVCSEVYSGTVTIRSPLLSTSNSLSMGATPVTTDAEAQLTVNNYGSASLVINRVVFDKEGFSVKEMLPLSIDSWNSTNLTVVYSGIEQADFSAIMQLYSNDPDQRVYNVNITGSRFAPNYLSIAAKDIFIDNDLKMVVSLDNYDPINGMQFDVTYPSAYFTPNATLETESRAAGLSMTQQPISEDVVRCFIYSLTNSQIAAGSGEVFTLTFNRKGDVPEGSYLLNLSNIILGSAELQDKYAGTDINTSFVVKQHDPITITAKDYTINYGDEIPAFGYTTEGATLSGEPAFSCEATTTSPVGTYPIVITKGSVTNEEDTYVNGTLTIVKAPLTITAKSYTRKQGEENPTFEVEYAGFKNNETSDVLTTQPTVSCAADATSDPGTYEIVPSGATAVNYEISYVNGTLTVNEADPVTITAKSYTIYYGDALPAFGYDTEGAPLEGTPELSCTASATSGVGTYEITVSKGTVSNYNVSYVNGTLTIVKAPLTVSVGNYTKKQGEENPAFTLTYAGFKNGETSDVLTTLPTASTTATLESEPGEYVITVSGGNAENYEFSYIEGKLIVTEADPVVVTAVNVSREYGEPNPEFEFTIEGAPLDGTPEIICEAMPTSPVGTYPIIIRKGSVKNYNDTYVNGTLTITKAPLTITAKSYTRKQGEENPTFEVEYAGFKNNETSDVLTTQPTVSCAADATSDPGTYVIVPSGATAANYEISYVNGTLTVVYDPDSILTILSDSEEVDIYSMSGRKIQAESLRSLPRGIYIVNGRKVLVK